jgi:hypothetical protein
LKILVTSIGAIVAGCLVASCGGTDSESSSDLSQVREVFVTYQRALRTFDAETICRDVYPPPFASDLDSCKRELDDDFRRMRREAVRKSGKPLEFPRFRITKISLADRHAEVTAIYYGKFLPKRRMTLSFSKVAGEWRLAVRTD